LQEVVIDVNMSLDFISPGLDETSCILPSGTLWLMNRRRRIFGEELLRLQGVDKTYYPRIRDSTDALLTNLAGNAFNLAAVAAFTFCAWGVAEY
jgi:hypothetical protein